MTPNSTQPGAPRSPHPDSPTLVREDGTSVYTTTAANQELRPQTPINTWLIEGILPKGRVVLLAAPPGSGKSYLALHFAAQLTRGACQNKPISPLRSEDSES